MRIPRFPNVPNRIALTGNTRFFFDRQFIRNSLNKAEWTALTRASLKVKDYARKSIKKRGAARIPLKIARAAGGGVLGDLRALGMLGPRVRNAVIREVQRPPASPAGTPPFTHTPYEGHQASYLGFRRNLWNFYDPQTRSAVVGPSAKGRNLPFLHEFGGTVNTQTMVWIPKLSRSMRRPIVREVGEYGGIPKPRRGWAPVGAAKTKTYPARPFMRPALRKAIMNGAIAKAFANTFGGARVSAAGQTFSG